MARVLFGTTRSPFLLAVTLIFNLFSLSPNILELAILLIHNRTRMSLFVGQTAIQKHLKFGKKLSIIYAKRDSIYVNEEKRTKLQN